VQVKVSKVVVAVTFIATDLFSVFAPSSMMYIFSVAVLISQLKVASAECAAYFGGDGTVAPLDTCYFGIVKYYCENGVAYSAAGFTEENCGGDATFVEEVDLTENTVYCDADPCETVTLNFCTDEDCTDECSSIPYVLNQCAEKPDENGTITYESTYCDSSSGLVTGTYSDSGCSNMESSFPLAYLEAMLGAAEGCFSIDTECEGDAETAGTFTSCDGDDCDENCFSIPIYENQCIMAGVDEDTGEQQYTSTYCDSSSGLQLATYSDSECSDQVYAIPYEIYAEMVSAEGGCITIDTDCVGSEEPTTTRGIECPTGSLDAVLDDDIEAPYIPLGLCNKANYGAIATYNMYECNSDGEVMQYLYGSTGCSGDPASSQVADFGDDPEFVAKCNEDLECKYVRMNIFAAGDDGSCPTDPTDGFSYEFAAFTSECVTFNSTTSYVQSCTDTTATRDRYTNADCSGDAVETVDIMSDMSECGGEVVECYMEEPDLDGNGNGNDSAGFKMGLVMVAAICNFLFL